MKPSVKKALLGEATERSVAKAKPALTVKAMEAVKILDVQPRGTPRRKRARNVQKVAAGTGEALLGRSVCGCPPTIPVSPR